jgi:FKBP-type peptidyl-prolyl cis-trans isomerase (trigger factor)
MNTTVKKLDNGNTELTITIPWTLVKETYNTVVEDIVKETELSGFRKGKAPRSAVEESLDKNKTYEEVLKRLIPDSYAQAVTEHSLKPIISPAITLTKAKEEEDWTVTALTCEKPALTLGDYRKAVTELKNEKQNKIWVPGQEPKKTDEEETNKKPKIDELLDAVYKTTVVFLPAILIEQEVTRMLSNFLDQTKKLGITVDQYLASTGKTIEIIRKEYEEEAKRIITLELALGEIADKEKIQIEDKDVDEVINTAKTPQEREGMEKERYYLASILRRQKTIQLLASL